MEKRKKRENTVYEIDPVEQSGKRLKGRKNKTGSLDKYFSDPGSRFSPSLIFSRWKQSIKKKKNEMLTLMLIPHNEDKAKSIQISSLYMNLVIGLVTAVIVVSSVLIVNHTSSLQEVDKLRISQKDAKIQFSKIREEVKEMDLTFSKIRSKISRLYAMANGEEKPEGLYYGVGGGAVPIESVVDSTEVESGNTEGAIPVEVFMLHRIEHDLKNSEEPLKEVGNFFKKRENIIQNTPTIWPVEGYLVNPYGPMRNAQTLKVFFNPGVDIATTPGASVVTTAPGVVSEIYMDSNLQWVVKIRHTYGYETMYQGLEKVSVKADEQLVKGDTIGMMGVQSGRDETVLHYRIYIGIEHQDPLPYLSYLAQ